MDPIDLEVVRGSKKESCPYCGESEHKVPLACPRIRAVVLYDDSDAVEIQFWPTDEPLAAG